YPMTWIVLALAILAAAIVPNGRSEPEPLPGTRPLEAHADLAAEMVAGLDRFVTRETAEAAARRGARWRPDLSSPGAYSRALAPPDCDMTPEALAGCTPDVPPAGQFARRLAESGCEVLVPTLLDRSDAFSGNPAVRMTNQPHREFVYRGAFEMGRHVIGYEV